ncbi:MAG TPA: T9SS type A sorting domain-containing protein [Flavobacterium sp.]|uniref:T9SS type A sorting domain-containing protein n=1 Tax=unclassified Flavobacterium TaxID=196869 RepID=UPI0025C5466D|nr:MULTISPECIES: T9SS type A sorting domain-containing protein [unclassified Flavobacterium]HRE76828.1 T9SS type A sorting domain-containing protein [Flavobacterium sp.]
MKINNLLIAIALMQLVQLTTYAQNWSYYKDYPLNVSPWDADSDNLGNLYMLTSSREVWKKNGLGTWSKFPNYSVENYYDIMVRENTGTVFLADELWGLVYTSNEGAPWQQASLETNPNSGHHESIYALSNINTSNVFFGGGLSVIFPFPPAIYKYTLSGNSVSNIQQILFDSVLNYDNIPECVYQTLNGNTIIIGTQANGIFTSLNGGQSFQNTLGGEQVYKIVEGPNNTFYALSKNLQTNQNKILKSTNGINWISYHLNSNPNSRYTTLFYDSQLLELWVGTENTIYKISNLNQETPVFVNQNLNNSQQRVVSIVKSNGVIHQFSSEFIAQKLENNSWISETNGFIGSTSQILFDSNNALYSLDFNSSMISKSTTSGAGWMNFYIPGHIQAGLEYLNKDGNGNVFFTKLNKLYKMNSANNLQEINVPNPNAVSILRLYVAPNGNIYLTHHNESNKLYRSTNMGQTWQMILQGEQPFSSICENNQGVIFCTFQSNQAELYYSTNNGQNWNVFTYDFNSDFECGSATESFIYGSGDSIFLNVCLKTFLLQLNESVVVTTEIGFPNNSFPGYILSTQNGFYTVSGDEVVYKSSNNGQSWQSMGKPLALEPYSNSVYSLLYSNSANEVFVQTSPFAVNFPESLRGLYKLTETLSLPEHNNESDMFIYPNPSNGIIHISSKIDIDFVQLYDIQGKNISLNPITSNILDISHLEAGVYLLKVAAINGELNTLRIIKK